MIFTPLPEHRFENLDEVVGRLSEVFDELTKQEDMEIATDVRVQFAGMIGSLVAIVAALALRTGSPELIDGPGLSMTKGGD